MENMDYIAIPRDEYRDLIAENVRMGLTLDNLHDLLEREDLIYSKTMGDRKTYYGCKEIKDCIHYVESSHVTDKIAEYIEEYKAKKGE